MRERPSRVDEPLSETGGADAGAYAPAGPAASRQAASTVTSAATHTATATHHQALSALRECCLVSVNIAAISPLPLAPVLVPKQNTTR